MSRKLEETLKERLHTKRLVRNNTSASGGCISKGYCYSIDDGEDIFVKTSSNLNAIVMFEGESQSLKHISSTKTIRVPQPKLVLHNFDEEQQTSAIVMEYLNIKHLSDNCAKNLGHDLANMHDYNNKLIRFKERASKWVGHKQPSVRTVVVKSEANEEEEDEDDNPFTKHSMKINEKVGRVGDSRSGSNPQYPDRFVPEPSTEQIDQFGFDVPTSCGSIPQCNEWTDDWVVFYARHRLDKSIRSLLSDHGDRELSEQWSQLQLKIGKFFSDIKFIKEDKIVPALLHGDLWSGNMAQVDDSTQAVIYDPSSFYGHSEYEFGIARMFGGISSQVEQSYFELLPKRKLFEQRNKLYQLFHHLNHWDHFGSGYRTSSLALMKKLNTMV